MPAIGELRKLLKLLYFLVSVGWQRVALATMLGFSQHKVAAL
jgi:hypothetical protein